MEYVKVLERGSKILLVCMRNVKLLKPEEE